MSIFRNARHPLGVRRDRPPVDATLSKIRWFSDPESTVEPDVSGRVKWFSRHRGYGFIDIDEDYEVFVHYSSIKGRGYRILEEGDRVTFDLVKSPRGYQAMNVRAQDA